MLLALALLYAAATGVLLVFGLNHLVLAAQHLRRAPPPPPARPPSTWPPVTVQIPLYNERAVAARVIDACAALDYPRERLEVQVLDDSTDETVDVVAARVALWRGRGLRIAHLRRRRRDGYKAGALAHGLTRAHGELLAVFDADFVPPPDFLRRTVPLFAEARTAAVQARWGHLNAHASALTAAQAALLDAHFGTEQEGRARAGWPLTFNGTAGIWRRAAIEDAGGWRADTLTEDLDLSYRAQLRGWRLRYVPDLVVPAELPTTHAAWRQQQFRWTKGGAETARRLLGPLWRSRLPLVAKLQGTLHLGGFAVYPAALVLGLLHAPLMVAYGAGAALPDVPLRLLEAGTAGFVGVVVGHALAQRAFHARPLRRLVGLPWWLAAALGLAASNTRAAWQGLRGRSTPFERTPKGGAYAPPRIRAGVEVALAAYAAVGLGGLVVAGAWAAVPLQVLLLAGFGAAAWPERAGTRGRRTFQPPRAGSPGPS